MTAYSFKARFAEPIVAGTKGGTIRATRKWRYGSVRHAEIGGHAFPGEELQLYTGMRTRQCRLIVRKTCAAVEPITIDFYRRRLVLGEGPEGVRKLIQSAAALNRFALFDGFADFAEMTEFWHPGGLDILDDFHGWHIRWMELPQMGWTRG